MRPLYFWYRWWRVWWSLCCYWRRLLFTDWMFDSWPWYLWEHYKTHATDCDIFSCLWTDCSDFNHDYLNHVMRIIKFFVHSIHSIMMHIIESRITTIVQKLRDLNNKKFPESLRKYHTRIIKLFCCFVPFDSFNKMIRMIESMNSDKRCMYQTSHTHDSYWLN